MGWSVREIILLATRFRSGKAFMTILIPSKVLRLIRIYIVFDDRTSRSNTFPSTSSEPLTISFTFTATMGWFQIFSYPSHTPIPKTEFDRMTPLTRSFTVPGSWSTFSMVASIRFLEFENPSARHR